MKMEEVTQNQSCNPKKRTSDELTQEQISKQSKDMGNNDSDRNIPEHVPEQQTNSMPSSTISATIPSSNNNSEEEEASKLYELENLLQMGESQATLDKLKNAGIYTMEMLAIRTKRELFEIKGISEVRAESLLQKASQIYNIMNPIDCDSLLKENQQSDAHISTGSKELDKLLDGGIKRGVITEFEGEYRTGKSQLCMTLAVMCQLPSPNGNHELSGKAFYLDTYGKLSPQRLVAIANGHDCDVDTTLRNVNYLHIYNTDHLLNVLTTVVPLHLSSEKYALLVVDSIISLFVCGNLAEKEMQSQLRKVMKKLMELGSIFGIAVVITNEVEDASVDSSLFKWDIKKPLGSHAVSHAVHTRVQLRKGRGENRIAKIVSDPALPESEASFAIGSHGIQDSSE